MKSKKTLLELHLELSPLYLVMEDFMTLFSKTNQPLSCKVKRTAITQLIAYLDDLSIIAWSDVHIKDLKNYIALRAMPLSFKRQNTVLSPLSATSLRTHISALRVFFSHLVDQKICPNNPILSIRPPKLPQYLPKSVEASRLINIIDQAPNTYLEVRDQAMIELFYSSGLRLEELTQLDINEIDLEELEVRVNQGKGGKDRVVPLGTKARDAILLWLEIRSQLLKNPNNLALFLNKNGTRISSRQVSNRVKEFAKKSGSGVNLHPHLLRHCMATHMLEGSKDIRAVQELLGHANIATTEIYTHLNFEHLAKEYDKNHPRAHKKPTETL